MSTFITDAILRILVLAIGAQVVHLFYKPLVNYSQLVEEEKARIRQKIAENKTSASISRS